MYRIWNQLTGIIYLPIKGTFTYQTNNIYIIYIYVSNQQDDTSRQGQKTVGWLVVTVN